MTPREYMRLRAGDIIISRNSKRTMRLVISDAGTCIGLAKVGHSWTDPNPGAWYSAWETQNQFETTDQRAPGALRQVPLYFRNRSGSLTRSR